ncbi:cache domain-containing protein [Agrobacterium sp. SHOUNA12C]|uniref:histidine kinase n=1 Tax=Rhizobium rhizogenes NBRC 13257 TaxID=1220581 RepID=A0AA87U8M8_RHIRH|nr:cache domain-containing protein [Rhizobium rhizogenes]MCJ9722321.1 cache domain-containing protein [Agrobacterium sp. BETTINA12B]MCJ9759941.1 cache domain-containing protein [Agrobacterium sp. SHOUNA12C]NTF57725.1 HAMP domain-containing protein [Rhizobium rhizogenes]NTF64144.1 HAMP domain-containing protein [Rhizobium rhizogenes]NTF77307.1 HAMP domain-containing protein [Rhizobium rhizogenes]
MFKRVPGMMIGKRSVRHRLLAIALVPMLVILPLLLGISIYRWNSRFDAMTVSKVNDDLTIAHQYLGRILENTEGQLFAVSESARFQELLQKGNGLNGNFSAFLKGTAQGRRFDFLYVVSDDGHIIVSGYPMSSPPIRWNWPAIGSALEGRSKTSIDVFGQAELAAISPELAQRARIEIVPTVGSAATNLTEETRGLVLQSAIALILPDGRRAALVGGILLNQNLAFVDTINDLIYHGSGLPEGSHGTVTLFLDDVRISTNVHLFEGRRAIGTRVSAEVRNAVLDQGRTWLDSAFVVNGWYISGYEPILDSYNRRVGMLYAGFLEKPITQAKYETLLTIVAAFLIAVAATVPLFLIWARSIFKPLERMTGTIARVEGGDLSARTGPVENRDEIGQVALHLDHLLDLTQQRDAELRQLNEELNQRVEQRALELHDATRQLETTTKQLVMSEKLAVIGEITAGVAHEINNPIAVMQGNLEVIREVMGSDADNASTEFRLIGQQMHRISEIVTKLLQFAKPQEYSGYSEHYAAAGIVSDTLPLVQHLLKKTTIALEREDRALRPIMMSRTELQQVLVNLIVNAIHAMPNGGRLTLRTIDSDMDGQAGVAIQVEDTGMGMAPDVIQKIFDPFFTTKTREGTGLGLSVSQMLMARQGGKIAVRSEPGKGTTFTVWMPEAH